jgi:hypothetical protein
MQSYVPMWFYFGNGINLDARERLIAISVLTSISQKK